MILLNKKLFFRKFYLRFVWIFSGLAFLVLAVLGFTFFYLNRELNPDYQSLFQFVSESQFKGLLLTIGLIWFLGFVLSFVGITLLFMFFSKKCWRSLRFLEEGLKALNQERFDYRIKETLIKEKALKDLAEIFNKTIKKLQKKDKEAREKIDDLEKFRQLTVGRELKMKQLKQENERLRKQIQEKQKW